MSENLNELGLTPVQQKAYEEGLAATENPGDIEQHMRKFAKLAEENEVLSRADQIKAGRDESSAGDNDE